MKQYLSSLFVVDILLALLADEVAFTFILCCDDDVDVVVLGGNKRLVFLL